MRPLFLVLLALVGAASGAAKEKPPASYTIPLPPRPDFAALDWLVGEWVGKTTGRGPRGEVRLSVAYHLEKRFMVFRQEISLPATKNVQATNESWMGVLGGSRSDSGFVLRVFSSTGFVTRYRVTVEGTEIRFNPEGGEQPPPGWLFRRVFVRLSDAEFSETVQTAPPSKPFFDYYTARLIRVQQP